MFVVYMFFLSLIALWLLPLVAFPDRFFFITSASAWHVYNWQHAKCRFLLAHSLLLNCNETTYIQIKDAYKLLACAQT
jgi:hypothetical protein